MTMPYYPARFPVAPGSADELPRRSVRAVGDPSQDTGVPYAAPVAVITRQVPEEAAPSGSTPFTSNDSAATNAAGVVLLPNASVTIDAGNYGVLKAVDFFVTPYTLASVVTFALLVNGSPVRGFEAIGFMPAAIALASRGFDLSLQLPQGATVAVQARNVDGGAYVVGCQLYGWQWPVAIDGKYRPEGVR